MVQVPMMRRKAIFYCVAGIVAAMLLFWVFRGTRNHPCTILLPENVSLTDALRMGTGQPPKGWETNRFTRYSLREQFTVWRMKFLIQDFFGRGTMPVPNPPRGVELTMALADCSCHSGETYLLAKELIPVPYVYGSNGFCLGFMFGGTNQAKRVRDWALLHEEHIARNGVIANRDKQPKPTALGVPQEEPFLTNQCAVIRDTKGVVKIIPLNCLRSREMPV